MKKRIEVIEAIHKEGRLYLKTDSGMDDNQTLRATGQMLVDSDQFSFIYVLDNGEDFVYLSVKEEFWPSLKEVLEKNLEVYANILNGEILLENFHSELQYLTENIKDNANYGNEMEQKVVEVFHS